MDQVARIALDTLRRDLSSLHPIQIEQQVESGAAGETQTQLGVTFVGEDATGPEGRPEDSLRFTATLAGASSTRSQATVSAGRGDLAEVLYKLDVDEATPERGLVRVVNWQPGLTGTEAQPEVTQLAPTATSLQIRYYTTDTEREGVDADGWCEDWQDAQMVPNAVAVNLGLTADTPQAIEEQFNLTLRLPLTGARYKPPRPEQSKASEVTGDTKDGGIEAK